MPKPMKAGSIKSKIYATSHKIEKINIPEYPFDIFMRPMSGVELETFQKAQLQYLDDNKVKPTPIIRLQALLLALTICDATGELEFENEDEVLKISSLALDALSVKASEINHIGSGEKSKS